MWDGEWEKVSPPCVLISIFDSNMDSMNTPVSNRSCNRGVERIKFIIDLLMESDPSEAHHLLPKQAEAVYMPKMSVCDPYVGYVSWVEPKDLDWASNCLETSMMCSFIFILINIDVGKNCLDSA